jgi:quinol monooxygenase YgiN
MIHVVARISAKTGKGPALLAAFKELLPQVHAEAGCVAYVPTVDAMTDIDRQNPLEPDVVTMVEQWESLDHLKAHLDAPHMHAFRSSAGDLIEGADLRILEER